MSGACRNLCLSFRASLYESGAAIRRRTRKRKKNPPKPRPWSKPAINGIPAEIIPVKADSAITVFEDFDDPFFPELAEKIYGPFIKYSASDR